MMKSKNTKWFTLVELIIVITILAVLATIAFVSFQSYTKDARNSKRVSDLNSLASATEVKLANGVTAISLVDTAGNTRKKNGTTDILAGYACSGSVLSGATNNTKYAATDLINFALLGVKKDDFTDPKGGNYLIGATTLAGGVYEYVNDAYETDSGTGVKIDGNYKYRTMSNSGIAASTGTYTNNQYTFTLSGTQGLGMFKIGDITNNGEIIGVSSDLTKLTLSWGATSPYSSGSIFLSGLIMASGSGEVKSLVNNLSGY